MFHLDGVSPHPSVTGLLFPIRIWHMVQRHILRWGPWTRCIMANNAVNVSALSCRIIPIIGAGLNQWYRPRAKLLKTPLVIAT